MRSGPIIDHQGIIPKTADGALTARTLVKVGSSANIDVAPISGTDNEQVIGYVGEPYADGDMVDVQTKGRVELISDGAVDVGDFVVSGSAATKVQSVANLGASDKALLHIVGRCVEVFGDAAGADGSTIIVELGLYDSWYAV